MNEREMIWTLRKEMKRGRSNSRWQRTERNSQRLSKIE